MKHNITTIVFDLGNVLIDWNPRYLYRKIFKTEEEVTWFLENVCTSEWNDEQDAGRSFEDATLYLVEKHPEHREAIEAWYGRWQETIGGPIHGSVALLESIRASNRFRLFALTNWSAETFPWALDNFHFLHWFQGIVVSGIEKCRKPDPKFFHILISRHDIEPRQTLFIDDNFKNVEAAKTLGFHTVHFSTPEALRSELDKHGLI